MTIVEFFFDIISPFSCLQHELLQRQIGHWKSMELKYTPVMIRKIMEASQNQPPGLNPSKAAYLFSDLQISSEFFKIPFEMPENFMQTALSFKLDKTQLFMMAMQRHLNDENVYQKLVGIFYRNFFSKNSKNVWESEVMKELSLSIGIDAKIVEAALNEMESEENRKKLEENNQRLIELGAFGLPVTLVHDKEKEADSRWVFGSDRMHIIGYLLKEKESPILRP